MLSMLLVVLYFTFNASVVAQSLPIVCVAGQCLQGFSNTTIGAKLSAPGTTASVLLLPGQYTSTTNPQLLHTLLTTSSATLSASPGFNASSLSSFPVNIYLNPGLVAFPSPLYSGPGAFLALPTVPTPNSSIPLSAAGLLLSNNVFATVSTGSNNDRIVIWDAIPDISQLPFSSSTSFSVLDLQSSSCSPACSGSGVCSASGTCICSPGFSGASCETCANGFFGPTCQPCPANCTSCDQGISGSGLCLAPIASNPLSSCNCLNGVCGSNGQCSCNTGWVAANNGTSCAQCAPGFFLTSTGDCKICEIGCSHCTDITGVCITCKQGFTQDQSDKTKCDPLPQLNSANVPCPDGSFSSGGNCAACSPSCQTCSGPSSNDCILCAPGSFLFNNSCVGTNAEGICQGTNGMIADNNKNECDSCGAKCTSCQIPNFSRASTANLIQCTGCLPGLFLSQGVCVASCPSGTVVSAQDNLTCIPCSSSCSTCVGSANFCLSCPSGGLASSGQCVSTCPSNAFSSSGSCVKCHPDCASCSGASFNQCSTCPSQRRVLAGGRCLPTCAKSQFFDATSSSCLSCDSSCSSCSGSGPNSCLACSSSTQILLAGSCVSANCNGTSNVIPELGVCLSELVIIPTKGRAPAPSSTGFSDPTVSNVLRSLTWWQILLMALGCAFIFVVIVMLLRRRAKKQRTKRTKMFASAKRLGNPNRWWRWRFGKRKGLKADVLPIAYNDHERSIMESRPQSIASSHGSHRDIKMKTIPAPDDRLKKKPSEDDLEDFIDAYSRSSWAPTTLQVDTKKGYNQRRIERDSIYSQVTGKRRHTPEPRQPLKRQPSGASGFTRSTRNAKQGVLVDLEEESKTPPLPLQLVKTGTNYAGRMYNVTPTEAQAYMMAVRPTIVTNLSQTPYHASRNPVATTGSYWLTPVTQPPGDSPEEDVVVIQPMNTGGSTSNKRNPFRQGMT